MASYTVNVELVSVPTGGVLTTAGAAVVNVSVDPVTSTAITAAVAAANMSTFVSKGELLINVKNQGAHGDGSTDDVAAFTAAFTAASGLTAFGPTVVWVPYTSTGYRASGDNAIPSGVKMRGDRKVLIKKTGSSGASFFHFQGTTDSGIEGLTIDSNGLCTTSTVNIGTSPCTRTTIRDNLFVEASTSGIHVFIHQSNDTKVFDNYITGSGVAIRVDSNTSGQGQHTTICGNRMYGWQSCGVQVLGQSATPLVDLKINDNTIAYTGTATSGSRQPISFQGSQVYSVLGLQINRNVIDGTNASFTATSSPGSADQIAVKVTQDFEITGNTVRFGGDNGIAISPSCERGVVANNVCVGNDTNGIFIGVTGNSSNIAVTGNVLMNNGQNRNGDRTTTGRGGLNLSTANNIAIDGNVFSDDQGTPTQQYGLIVQGTSDSVAIGKNVYKGNVLNEMSISGTATNVSYSAVKSGTATLVAGTVTVADTAITTSSIIKVDRANNAGTAGALYVSAKVASTSFTVTSTNAADTSTVYYEILRH